MAEWRDRGYVPDSDEDEEDIIESPVLPKSTPTSHTPVKKDSHKNIPVDRDPSSSPDPLGELPSAPIRRPRPPKDSRQENESARRDHDSLPSLSQILTTTGLGGEGVDSTLTLAPPTRSITNLFSSSPPLIENQELLPSQQGIESRTSSPLSSARSVSTISSPTRGLRHESLLGTDAELRGDNDEGAEGQRQHDGLEATDDEGLSIEALKHLEGVRRSKRHREPIQLHPYLLEEQRYQQTVKSRGLKPVRVAYSQSRNSPPRRNSGGFIEDVEYESERGNEADGMLHREDSSIRYSRSVSRSVSIHEPDESADVFNIPLDDNGDLPTHGPEESSTFLEIASDEDQELPDVQILLRAGSNDSRHHVQKKRKIGHVYGKRSRYTLKSVEVPERSTLNIQDESSQSHIDQVILHDSLTSPPLSPRSIATQTRSPLLAGFRVPPCGSPQPLPTPATSSEPRKPQEVDVLPVSSSLVESDNEGQEALNGREKSLSPTPEIPQYDDNRRLQRLGRKIRGVLPASWLKLDRQAQKKSTKASPSKHSGRRREQTKGIARRISHTHRDRPTPPDSSNLISDDSDNSDREVASRKSNGPNDDDDDNDDDAFSDGVSNVTFETPIDLDDIREDNRIDLMLPSLSRPSKRSRPRKRQTRLNISSSAPIGRQIQRPHRISKPKSKQQPRITDRLPRSRKILESRPVPRLSVLDSADLRRSPQRIPRFLKVAARKVRSKRNKGCHSPSKKFVRLSTRADTEDATRTLEQWKNGAIVQRQDVQKSHSGSTRSRPPLQDRPANDQLPSFQDKVWQLEANNIDHPAQNVAPLAHPIAVSREQDVSRAKQAGRLKQGQLQKTVKLRKPQQSASKQGHLMSSFRTANVPRAAQWEAISTSQRRHTSSMQVAKPLLSLTRNNLAFHSSHAPGVSVPLSRFLSELEQGSHERAPLHSEEERIHKSSMHRDRPQRQTLTHRPRKKPPKRLDTEIVEVRQPIQPTIELDDFEDDYSIANPPSGVVLTGFTTPYATYTINFDASPLQPGTYFHQSSFVGSEEFSRSLNICPRDFDQPAGYASLQFHDRSFRWGPWNETVSSDFGDIFQGLSESLGTPVQEQPPSTSTTENLRGLNWTVLRFITSYVTTQLRFIDRIDRESFTVRCVRLVQELANALESIESHPSPTRSLSIIVYALVLVNQVRQIIGQLDPTELRSATILNEVERLIDTLAAQSFAFLASETALKEIRSFLEANKQYRKREAGVRDDDVYTTAVVVVFHLLGSSARTEDSFWTSFSSQLTGVSDVDLAKISDIRDLEKLWSGVFALIPLLEFNRSGIFDTRSRVVKQSDNWPFVQRLVKAVTDVYLTNSNGQPASFNTYFRAILSRCFYLLKQWGWKRCEKVLETFFDFFAGIGLAYLRNEDSYGSPAFLDELESSPTLELEPSDRSFQILLKFIAQGLQGMNQIYPNSKIRSIVWRLMPNHGRSYPKEKPIRHEDLDALRNQYDLFCVLYWASPAGFRPRLATIKNLVHPASSHREACSISIRSWARLVRFQLSTDEPAPVLVPFAEWHDDFVIQMLDQHKAARTEAESASITLSISTHSMEITVAENQRQTEALLTDALLSLSKAYGCTRSLAHAQVLMTDKAIPGGFHLLDARNNRVNAVIMQGLGALISYIRIWQGSERQNFNEGNIDPSEDSQEFGDWTGFDEVCQDQGANEGIQHLQAVIYDSLCRLVSNCFGSDASPADSLLIKVLDCWTLTARALVKEGLKQWNNYFSSYDRESWMSLRTTEQTRKFTALFFALILEKDCSSYEENKSIFLSTWLSSLVERESMLKFQHRLTSAILNADSQNALLSNLPFSMNPRSGKYDVRMEEFGQRRLSLISCLLSSMRAAVFDASCQSHVQAQQLRQEYRGLLQTLMLAMKSNYHELAPENSTKGAYVDFVHRVIGFLQQYAVDICPVDRFFTDSAAFPLPATDPTYVVGRLRNYGLRLSEPGVAKQLVTFIQNVSERAAADEEQDYLVDQLHAAMSGRYEAGIPQEPTLRAFLLQNVFPAYIELALENAAAWAIIEPILRSIQSALKDLIFDIDLNDLRCLDSVTSMLTVVLESLHVAVENFRLPPTNVPIFLRAVGAIVSTVTSMLPIVDYTIKSLLDAQGLVSYIKYFEDFAAFVHSGDFWEGVVSPVSSHELPKLDSTRWSEARRFALWELRSTLQRNWGIHNGIIYVQRGINSRKELLSFTEEAMQEGRCEGYDLNETLQAFRRTMETIGFGKEETEHINTSVRARESRGGLDALFF